MIIESFQIMYAIIPAEVKVMILFGIIYCIYDLCAKHFKGDE